MNYDCLRIYKKIYKRKRKKTEEDICFKHRINFRVSEGQFLVIKLKAHKVGRSVSEYLRSAALEKKLMSYTDAAMVSQIRFVGVNLNQIARSLNKLSRGDKIDTHLKEISEISEELRKLYDDIYQKINDTYN